MWNKLLSKILKLIVLIIPRLKFPLQTVEFTGDENPSERYWLNQVTVCKEFETLLNLLKIMMNTMNIVIC